MRGAIVFVAIISLGSMAAQAHHSIAAVYDRDRPVTLDAVVVEFALVQPHPFVVADVKDGDTAGRWRGELDNRHELVAIGVKADTLKPGDRIVLKGSLARSTPRSIYVLRLDRPSDGFWYEQVGMSPRIGRR